MSELAVKPRAARGVAVSDSKRDREWVEELLEDWLATKAPTTLRAYQADFDDFSRFLLGDSAHHAVALATLMDAGESKAHRIVLAYKAELMRRPVWRRPTEKAAGADPDRVGLAPRTVNRRLASLRSIIRLARLGWTLDVPGTTVEAIKDTSGVPREAFLAMLEALATEAEEASANEDERVLLRALRDTLVLRLWHDLGLRRGSVWGIDMEDVNLRRRTVDVLLKGKGAEKKPKPLPPPTLAILKLYLAHRGREPGPLIFSMSNRSYGSRMNPGGFNKLLNRVVDLANVGRANPHKFRHTAITRALERGATVHEVQEFSDHADVRTLMLYKDRDGKTVRKVADLVAGDDD